MKCPKCGANIEVTELNDGSILVRQDCLCKIREIATTKEGK